nr:ScpA family protein [Tianweitania sediminis]
MKTGRSGEAFDDWARSAVVEPAEPELVVDVDGFEGPLDLLLHLARTQRVDLARISVLALAEQYLLFIQHSRMGRLELAADYLVMAAWLAFLKSRLLLPAQRGDGGESGEELAAGLQFRLLRLEAIREAAFRLNERPRLGREVFPRGMPEAVAIRQRTTFQASLYDLLLAYASQRQRQAVSNVRIARRGVWSLKEARAVLERLIGPSDRWETLDQFLLDHLVPPQDRATAIASTFAASLELAREQRIDLRQDAPFAPIFMRAGPKAAEPETDLP